MKIYYWAYFLIFCACRYGFADTIPQKCATYTTHLRHIQQHTEIAQEVDRINSGVQTFIQSGQDAKTGQLVYTIPVVVHVVYNANVENISDAQIQSQISVLNKDFRKLNTNLLPSNHAFYALIADAEIEFCLASQDPNGNTTSGITRKFTSKTSFTDDDHVKFNANGGTDAWNPNQYLNIWVCNLTGGLLGYAQMPSDFSAYPETDGVVIGYKYFGTTGSATYPFNQGRTSTHEIGHWLGLAHIWGDDADCSGSDGISDTPNQQIETYNCPSGIVTDNCSPNAPGIMYQNYMDYSDDACMSLFTIGQVSRMRSVLNSVRTSLLTANKCSSPTAVHQLNSNDFSIFPNPVDRYINLQGLPNTNGNYSLEVFSVDGKLLYTTPIYDSRNLIELPDFETGNYILRLSNERTVYVSKIQVR